MFRTIVAGVDGREGGRAAAELAARLAPRRLVLACSCPIEAHPLRWVDPDYPGQLRAEAHRMLHAVGEQLGADADLRVVLDLSPAHALHELTAREGADAIVVGPCRHPSAAGRVALGDVTTAVIADAPCPVVVARPPAAPPAEGALRIGVAFDGRAESRAALELAATIAEQAGGHLVVRTVVDPVPPLSVGAPSVEVVSMWPPPPDLAAWDRIVDGTCERARGDLDEALAGLVVPAAGEVVRGRVADELVRLSGEVDLVVCGSRGWGTVRRVLLGSASDHLVRHAACPVAVAPRPAAPS
jgi:nucleotide-binding universal stress UspA family protein